MKRDQYLYNPFISTDICLLLHQHAIQNAYCLQDMLYHCTSDLEKKNKFKPDVFEIMLSKSTSTILASSS